MTEAFPLAWPAGWPRTPADERERTQRFKVSADAVRREIYQALRALEATNIVVSSNVPLRNDGTPSADVMRKAMPDPGVAVYFSYRGRPKVMGRDGFTTPADNLRSLTWALRAMRQLEVHGGQHMADQAFQGFEALPPPRSHWDLLGLQPGASAAEIKAAWRRLVADAHPDREGGSEARAAEINAARDAALREVRT